MVTPDGCPVAVYAALPAEPELSIVRSHLDGRHSVLDLGAGAGRIANPLAAAGFDVVAVDESAAMLANVVGARTLVSRVEDLDLDERLDAVLMLSHLMNAAADQRRSLLEVVARHLSPDGVAIIQRLDPAHPLTAGTATFGDVGVELRDIDTSAWPVVSATTRYSLGGERWDQPWTMTVLDDSDIATSLSEAGLAVLSIDGAWITAALT